MHKLILSIMIFSMALVIPSAHAVQAPMDSLKGPVNEVIHILKDPKYQDETHKQQQWNALWAIIQQVFDFSSTARLALGKYYKSFNKNQFDEFTHTFSTLLANTYIRRLQGEYKNEKVNYISQLVKGNKALVKTEIIRDKMAIPVHYVMLLKDGNWRIYDVKVEGVSLVRNYRTQFHQILANNSPDYLIDQLKQKVKDQGYRVEKPN